MKPIQMLKDEHRTIKRALDALDRFVEMQENLPQLERQEEILRFVEFIRLFADRIHHGKEEDILFERMVATGFPRQAGPLAVMYHEHELGRAYVNELKTLGESKGQWSPAETRRLEAAALGYTALLRNHIHKEDNVLYPMAESGLGSEDLTLIDERFDEFEEREKRSGEKARLETLADELATKFVT